MVHGAGAQPMEVVAVVMPTVMAVQPCTVLRMLAVEAVSMHVSLSSLTQGPVRKHLACFFTAVAFALGPKLASAKAAIAISQG